MKRILPLLLLAGTVLGGSAGCVHKVFTAPVTLSTKGEVARHLTPVKPVSVQRSDYIFLIIPILHDPATGYDELLAAARAAGGDAVADVQFRTRPGFFLVPFFLVNNYEWSGMAVRTATE
ncbi:MAG: hypothetical protein WC789_11445 [Lentisphaeria bacterium]|jgi:hypothetical protein